jgi:hypothetical protein
MLTSLRERWYRFKAKPPSRFYSYVWWETLIGFYFIVGFLIFLMVFAVTSNWWFMAVAMAHVVCDFFWSRREVRRRSLFLPPYIDAVRDYTPDPDMEDKFTYFGIGSGEDEDE